MVEADKIDVVVTVTKEMDAPRSGELKRMTGEFSPTERIMPIDAPLEESNLHFYGYLSHELAVEDELDVTEIETDIIEVIEDGTVQGDGNVYLVSGLAVRVFDKKGLL